MQAAVRLAPIELRTHCFPYRVQQPHSNLDKPQAVPAARLAPDDWNACALLTFLNAAATQQISSAVQEAPSIAAAMQLLPPHATTPADSPPLDATTYAFAPSHAFQKPTTLHSRIVIVGASWTALSALRDLAARSDVTCPHITVLAPGGVEAAPALLHPELAAALMDGRTTILDAAMAAIDQCALTTCPPALCCFMLLMRV